MDSTMYVLVYFNDGTRYLFARANDNNVVRSNTYLQFTLIGSVVTVPFTSIKYYETIRIITDKEYDELIEKYHPVVRLLDTCFGGV